MRQLYLLVFFLYSFYEHTSAQSIAWQKCYGGFDMDVASAVEITADGGYILIGSTLSSDGNVTVNNGNYDIWVVKVDDIGALEWQKTYGGTDMDMGASIKPTDDGGYIIIGTTQSVDTNMPANHGMKDIWVVKLDDTGAVQWQQCFGGTDDDEAAAIQPTNDGGYVFAGKTFSNNGNVSGNHGAGDIWLVKLDNAGALQWQKCIGGTAAEKAADIQLTSTGYLIAGSTFSNNGDVWGNHGDFDYWVVATDVNGAILWQRTFGGTGTDEATGIFVTSDEGCIVAGYAYSNDGQVSGNHGLHDYWVVKLDKDGNPGWMRSFGGSQTDLGNAVIQTADGEYVVVGTTYSNNGDVAGQKGVYDYWVIKLTATGSLEKQVCLGGSSSEIAKTVRETANGELVVLGESYSIDGDVTGLHGNSDIWMVKLHSLPLTAKELNRPTLICYPDPVKEVLFFMERFSQVTVYSPDGRIMMNGHDVDKMDLNQLPAGVYIIEAMDKWKNVSHQQFVKE